MNDFLDKASGILNYGFIGFGFLLAFLAFLLLRDRVKSDDDIPPRLAKLLAFFMSLAIVLSGFSAILEAARLFNKDETSSWGSSWGDKASDAFTSGGDAEQLTGTWNAVWMEYDENGVAIPYQFPDPETGEMIEYPPEKMFVTAEGAVVRCRTSYSTGEEIDYWYEGRMSIGNHVTLVYWTPEDGPGSKLVGTVFLEYFSDLNQRPKLVGWWRGRTRDGEITSGTTVWTKVD